MREPRRGPALTAYFAEAEVLKLVAEGKVNKQISASFASASRRSRNTASR